MKRSRSPNARPRDPIGLVSGGGIMSGTSVRPLVAGNWKMNGLKDAVREALTVADALSPSEDQSRADVMICPPATLLATMTERLKGTRVLVGAQDCHPAAWGAHTGDLSAEMLRDAGASAVIVGHSERRADHGESDSIVRSKASAAHRGGLAAIVCIGETAGQRQAGLTLDIVRRQLSGSLPEGTSVTNTIVAYEPVWAIGTGLTPTTGDVAEVHRAIREALVARLGTAGSGVRVLYGGSVKPSNARELLSVADVDGALVGGASLKAEDFLAIIRSYA
jgi:triosephosphate isomerase